MSFECISCKKLFTTKQTLEYHKYQNVCTKKIEQDLKCSFCNKLFSTKQKLEYHIQNVVCIKTDEEMVKKMKEQQQYIETLEKDNK